MNTISDDTRRVIEVGPGENPLAAIWRALQREARQWRVEQIEAFRLAVTNHPLDAGELDTATWDAHAAYHEAGHAVLAVLLQRPVVRVYLANTPDGSGGCCEMRAPGFPEGAGRPQARARRAIRRGDVLTAVAGIAAERVRFGSSVGSGSPRGGDVAAALAALRRLHRASRYGSDAWERDGPRRDALLDAIGEAERILRAHPGGPALDAVAEHLAREREISGADVLALVRGVTA